MMHRRELARFSVLTFAVCGSWCAQGLAQGQSQPGRADVQTQQPSVPAQGQALIEEDIEVSPAVQQLLEFWEAKSSAVNQLYGEFERYSYDGVYFTERRCEGRLWFAAPDQGRIDCVPIEVPAPPNNVNPAKLDPNGVPYELQEDIAGRWICNGERVYAIDDTAHIYSEMTIPPQFQGENIIDSPLPFLFGMQAERAKQRYHIEIGSMHNPDGRIAGAPLNVHVIVTPRWQQDAREWTSAEILLNPDTFLPNAVRIMHSSHEEVYVFSRTEPALARESLWNGDPFNDRPPQHYQCADRQTAGAPQEIPLERRASAPPQSGVVPQ